MSEQENPALRKAIQKGMELGLSELALGYYVSVLKTSPHETTDTYSEFVDTENVSIPGEQIEQNFVTDFGSSQEHSGNIFSSEAPVDANRNTNEGRDKRKSTQSKKQENPWSKTTPSGYPRGPDSYAKKKSRKRDYRQESIRKRNGW